MYKTISALVCVLYFALRAVMDDVRTVERDCVCVTSSVAHDLKNDLIIEFSSTAKREAAVSRVCSCLFERSRARARERHATCVICVTCDQ